MDDDSNRMKLIVICWLAGIVSCDSWNEKRKVVVNAVFVQKVCTMQMSMVLLLLRVWCFWVHLHPGGAGPMTLMLSV